MTTPEALNEVGLKEQFFRYFQNEVTALQEETERLGQLSPTGGERNDAFEHCLAGIDRLSHEVKDASSYIPSYDQRTYSEAIKALREKAQKTRNSFDPPKKFSFKSRKTAAHTMKNGATDVSSMQLQSAAVAADHQPLESASPQKEKEEKGTNTDIIEKDGIIDEEGGTAIRRPSFSKTSKILIHDHKNLHVVLPASVSHASSSATISDLNHCIVNLSAPSMNGSPLSALYLKNIKQSLIICGRVDGAIHITNVENSIILIASRQFRMHDSRKVDVYLHCSSRPIFENCTNLRFSYLPNVYMTSKLKEMPNIWDQIDDFKWLKAEPSPHFSILPEKSRVGENVWKDKVQDEQDASLEDILKILGVF